MPSRLTGRQPQLSSCFPIPSASPSQLTASRNNTMLFRRAVLPAVRRPSTVFLRAVSNVPAATSTEASATTPAVPEGSEPIEVAERARHLQAPNRATTWSKSQRPKEQAMVGPRFEQTNISQQPAPWAAIELIHQQPVRWSEKRVVCCDGGRCFLGE